MHQWARPASCALLEAVTHAGSPHRTPTGCPGPFLRHCREQHGNKKSTGCLSPCLLRLPAPITLALQGDQEVEQGMTAKTEGREMVWGTENGRSYFPISAAQTQALLLVSEQMLMVPLESKSRQLYDAMTVPPHDP